ncbi:MAG TPA: histidine kinase dimerization/phospho-acceptor domain-containing protein, partial [Byssovorax sp.]
MTRLLVTSAAAIFLILFVAFVASRLVRSRTAGLSIRMQFFLALAGIVGAFALGLGLLVLDRLEARTTLIAEGAARDEAEAIAALVASEVDARGATLDEVAKKYAAPHDDGPGGAEDPRAKRGLALLDPSGAAVFATGLAPDEPGTVFVVAPIVARGRTLGSARVVKPTLVVRRIVEDFAPFVLVVSLVLGLAAAVAADLAGRTIAGPIEALTEFAAAVSEGERRAVPALVHGREVQRLTRAIDSMRRQIEGRPFVETFAADLSHELKNPVAAIRASAEVLADGALEEPEEAARFVGRIQEATTRIEALLGDLLSLARIEARGVEDARLIDVGDLVVDAVARAKDRGAPAELRADSDGGAEVRG